MELAFTERQIEIIIAATNRIDTHGIQELTIKNLAADIGLSEAALYRHFKGKNDILLGMLNYFIVNMNKRLSLIMSESHSSSSSLLKSIFESQLASFQLNPSIVSVIFSEGIFHFNNELSAKVSYIMKMMQENIEQIVKSGQDNNEFSTLIGSEALTTIIMGTMRLVVLKWKLSGHKTNLDNEGAIVLNGIIKMISR
ncbi:MAG: TetR/AcrR family transcriptional regulator [Bacteroidetes bacterium]|nr:MAG: TetR/AcrR family transcriptional regulator [Bacteroidota bacterium]MBL1145711.1 TetR/AcrR family transcriptional regulator [Bacteroidota bacterium]MCB0802984.1 TetR/AcrR family transcriptional regulator [Flavobacteriales bacterium]NOG58505.1 TetR/AcrR family transcriptional regulator [Bacteroidota bacterium]